MVVNAAAAITASGTFSRRATPARYQDRIIGQTTETALEQRRKEGRASEKEWRGTIMTKQQEPCKEKGAFRGANFGVAVAPPSMRAWEGDFVNEDKTEKEEDQNFKNRGLKRWMCRHNSSPAFCSNSHSHSS